MSANASVPVIKIALTLLDPLSAAAMVGTQLQNDTQICEGIGCKVLYIESSLHIIYNT